MRRDFRFAGARQPRGVENCQDERRNVGEYRRFPESCDNRRLAALHHDPHPKHGSPPR